MERPDTRATTRPTPAVDIAATVTTPSGTFRARTEDLSKNGISFYLPVPLDVGTGFSLELALVFEGNAQSEPLAVAGQVVWCTHCKQGYQIGATFLSTDEATQKNLQMFLDFLAESRKRT